MLDAEPPLDDADRLGGGAADRPQPRAAAEEPVGRPGRAGGAHRGARERARRGARRRRLVQAARRPGRIARGEVAILYRTRDQARPLEEALLSKRVPHHVLGSLGFFERAEVRDALAHLALVVNPHDRVALSRALGAQPGIGPVATARVAGYASDQELDLLAACRARGGDRGPPRGTGHDALAARPRAV